MEFKDVLAALEETKSKTVEAGTNAANAVVKAAMDDFAKTVDAKIATVKGLPEGFNPEQLQKDVADTVKGFEELQMKMKKQTNYPTQKKSFDQVFGEAVLDNQDAILKMANGEKGAAKRFDFNIDLKAVGDMSTDNVTGSTVWGAISRQGIIEDPKRKVHMREVIRGGSIGSGTDYYFMKQNGNGEGSIAFTAEGDTKPQFDEDLVESSVKIETLAGWERVTRKAMMNIPGFISFLQSRMIEKLYKAEDAGILYGTGTSPVIKGILTAGNFTASTSTSTVLVEKIIDDLALLEDTYERSANFILLRPVDYFSFFKNVASGSGEYNLPFNVQIVGGQLYISGVPVRATTALTSGDYIVGDLAGANFLTQEGMRVEFFEQDGDNVRNNKITIRIEETVALPVYGSNYFIKGAI